MHEQSKAAISEAAPSDTDDAGAAEAAAVKQRIREAGARARAEAETRRKADDTARQKEIAREIGGRDGPEPARYGDWEVKGLASDF